MGKSVAVVLLPTAIVFVLTCMVLIVFVAIIVAATQSLERRHAEKDHAFTLIDPPI